MASDITPEAVGFLSAVGIFVILLAILFLFINKKLCFARVGGLPCLEQYSRRKRRDRSGIHQGLVNSYGEGGEISSSSGSDDELAKQFEISVSRSQSFRSGVMELDTQNAPGQHHKFKRLLSDQEEGSTEPSDCEEAERNSVQSFQDPLSSRRRVGSEPRDPLSRSPLPEGRTLTDPLSLMAEQISVSPQDTGDRLEALPRDEGSRLSSVGRQTPQRSLAVDNHCYDNSEATDSISTWSSEHEQSPSHPLSTSPRGHISKCGDLTIALDYRTETHRLLVTVIMAQGIPDKARSGMDSWQVHVVLLPGKRQRHKTAVQKGSMPRFEETFRFSHLELGDLGSSALRFRLYALGKMNKERMMGEAMYRLNRLNRTGRFEITLVLEPRSNLKTVDSQVSFSAQSDSASSSHSVSHGGNPELLLGLSYNATTGRLSVEIIKGSHFRNFALNRPPDTFGRTVPTVRCHINGLHLQSAEHEAQGDDWLGGSGPEQQW
ncbi:synaptotagmin-16-like isoform X3 [Sinocyclocheilus anshuiensis]|uniref:synaptotagmin-16-like isoform X3 n=1 Tax=Sinocyclocheilus anshuiensis TaxID=1608454 RepID=UPI0007B8F60B|nr:PREDICTED: synaptotagmin-16-like isoform X3 [Sinocyclocheilus anshuiensis]